MRPLNDTFTAALATFGATATTYSPAIDCKHLVLLSLAISATVGGAGNGIATLQMSNDGLTWFDSATYTKAFAATGTEMWNIVDFCPAYARVKNVALAGTQALSIVVNGKGV